MLDKLSADFEKILKLVKGCPTELQETALKTILDNWFRVNTGPPAPVAPPLPLNPAPALTPTVSSQLPTSFSPFMAANALTETHLKRFYQPVGSGAQLILSDVPGKGKASKQISLALLLSVRQALGGGTFGCGLEELRQMCLHYNCYDSPIFAANLNNKGTFFKPRKKGEDIELSGLGMKKAAELIKGTEA